MTYIKHYPKQHNETLQRTLGVSSGLFSQQVVPTLLSIADNMSFLDWQLRLWEWNHTECFPERVTFVPDGFPVKIWAPSNRWLARLFRSGKYKEYVVKGHLTIAMGPGFPIRYTGPHIDIGVRHDARIFQEDRFLQARIKPWEYGLGDKQGLRRAAADHHRMEGPEPVPRETTVQQDGAALPWACGAPHWPGSGQPYGSVHYMAWLVHPACRGHEDRGAHGWAPGAYEGT